MWPRDCCEQGSSCRTGSAETGKGTKIPNKVWLVQAENLFSALLYTWSGYNDMQWSQISPVQKVSCGSRSLMMVRHWFVCAEGKHAWQKKKKEEDLWRAQISLLFYLSSGPASCYLLVCFWPLSSVLGMAAFPLAGICGINTKVIPTVSIGSDCSRQLLWYSNLRDSRTHLWVDVVAAICTNCII